MLRRSASRGDEEKLQGDGRLKGRATQGTLEREGETGGEEDGVVCTIVWRRRGKKLFFLLNKLASYEQA